MHILSAQSQTQIWKNVALDLCLRFRYHTKHLQVRTGVFGNGPSKWRHIAACDNRPAEQRASLSTGVHVPHPVPAVSEQHLVCVPSRILWDSCAISPKLLAVLDKLYSKLGERGLLFCASGRHQFQSTNSLSCEAAKELSFKKPKQDFLSLKRGSLSPGVQSTYSRRWTLESGSHPAQPLAGKWPNLSVYHFIIGEVRIREQLVCCSLAGLTALRLAAWLFTGKDDPAFLIHPLSTSRVLGIQASAILPCVCGAKDKTQGFFHTLSTELHPQT